MWRDREDQEKARRWKAFALSAAIEFYVLKEGEDVRKLALQLRENKNVDHLGVKRSTMQRVYEAIHFKRMHEDTTGNHLGAPKLPRP